MKTLTGILRKRITAGVLVAVPVGVTLLVLRLLYYFTAGILTPSVRALFGGLPGYVVSLVSVLVLVMLLYLVGMMTANLLGRRLFAWGGRLVERVPFVGTIYSATKQLVEALGTPSRNAFTSVVMVEFPQQGAYAIGFVTGTIIYDQGHELAKVLIPTSPNPTTGFLELIPAAQLRKLDLSIEDAIKLVASGGILAPERLTERDDAAPDTPGCRSVNEQEPPLSEHRKQEDGPVTKKKPATADDPGGRHY